MWRPEPPSATWSQCWCSSFMLVTVNLSNPGCCIPAAVYIFYLFSQDGKPAGNGNQNGDERESLQKNSSLCQSESFSYYSHRGKGALCLQLLSGFLLLLSRRVLPTVSSPSRLSATSSVALTFICCLARLRWQTNVSLRVRGPFALVLDRSFPLLLFPFLSFCCTSLFFFYCCIFSIS